MINTLNLTKTEEQKKFYRPANEKQRRFMYSLKQEILLSGAVAAGKSFNLCWKGLMLNLKYPGNRGLICRKEASTLKGSTLKTLFEQVLPEDWIIDYNKQEGELIHRTGTKGKTSSIVFSGLDKRASQEYPSKIGSTEFGWIGADEGTELDEGDWNMLLTRLRYKIKHYSHSQNSKIPRQIFTATNPDAPTHWMYDHFFNKKIPSREVILTTPYDNPYLPKEYLAHLENTLFGISRERLLYGKWVSAAGTIYKDFDINKHVIDSKALLINNLGVLEPSTYKRMYFGADSNFPLPRAGLIAGTREDGRIDILEEFYEESCHVDRLGAWLESWSKQYRNPIEGFHDPSDPNAIDILNKYQGVNCNKAENSVIPGIAEVSLYFAKNKIYIHESCVNLIKQLQTYVWKKNSLGEKPEKSEDHLVDALRYLLYSIREKTKSKKSMGRAIF